jgi:hypothetical protein
LGSTIIYEKAFIGTTRDLDGKYKNGVGLTVSSTKKEHLNVSSSRDIAFVFN